jgi:hypothetical protein
MKQLERTIVVALATLSLGLAAASTASATTLEVSGVAKNEAITINASLKSGTSTVFEQTGEYSSTHVANQRSKVKPRVQRHYCQWADLISYVWPLQ